MISQIRAEWRFDNANGWSWKTKLYNAFYLATYSLLPDRYALRVTNVAYRLRCKL